MADRRGKGTQSHHPSRESWTFIVPVGNLVLTEDVGREFKVERVTLVHRDRLPYVRKKHGLGLPVSELKKKSCVVNRFFEEADAYAVVRETGTREEVEDRCLKLVREELHLLSVSQLGYSRRRTVGPAVLKGGEARSYVSMLVVSGRDSSTFVRREVTSPQNAMFLSWGWKSFQDQLIFTNLRKILQRQTKVENSWRADLRRAALLVGESVGANDLLKSFIWNVAALETLLTKQDQEKAEDALQKRAEALLGWALWGEVEDNEGRNREVYFWEVEEYERRI